MLLFKGAVRRTEDFYLTKVCPFLCSSFKGSCRRLRGWKICPAQLGELATKGLKSLSASPYLPLKRENIYFIFSEFLPDRKGILVLNQHNLKTFHEPVFESDFYLLWFHLDYECIIDSLLYELVHQLEKLLIFLGRKIIGYNPLLLVRFNWDSKVHFLQFGYLFDIMNLGLFSFLRPFSWFHIISHL